MTGLALWRDRWRTWLPAFVFFALNLLALALYQFVYADRVQVLAERAQTLQRNLSGLQEQRADLESKSARVGENRAQIAALYHDRFSTERERLTKTLAEFKTLATRAGLEPKTISYPEQDLAQFGLVKKSIVFVVDGEYAGLRQLLHLLDLSPTFFTLEEVRLTGDRGGGQRLNVALRMSTLFVNEDAKAASPAATPVPTVPAPPPVKSQPDATGKVSAAGEAGP